MPDFGHPGHPQEEVIMPIISTNNAANESLNYLNLNSSTEANSLAQLASGQRIVQASTDPAGLAIGTQLQATVTVFTQDETNVSQGTSILQSTDGALAQISNVLSQMLSLAANRRPARSPIPSAARICRPNTPSCRRKSPRSSAAPPMPAVRC